MKRWNSNQILTTLIVISLAGCGWQFDSPTTSSSDRKDGPKAKVDSATTDAGRLQGKITLATQQRENLMQRLSTFHDASDEQKARIANDVAKWLVTRTLDEEDVKLADRAIIAFNYETSGVAQQFARQVGTKFAPLKDKIPGAEWIDGWAHRQLLDDSPIEIEGQTIQGKTFDWQAYRGRVVLVEFWATWCGPCHDELARVLALYDEYHDAGFDVVGIATDNNLGVVQSYVRRADLPWTTIHCPADRDGSLSKRFGVRTIPCGILVDRNGNVISIQTRGDELNELLADHLSVGG